MKKVKVNVICLLLCGGIVCSSCIGSFGLFNKVRTWNQGVSQDKFVNELVFFALAVCQVYTVTALADILVINSIEFWSGSNPIAHAGETKQVKGENGEFLVKTNADGYTITNEVGEEITLKFDEQEQSWNLMTDEGEVELMVMNDDGTVNLNLQNDTYMRVTLDAQGMMAARQALSGKTLGVALR